MTGRTVAVALVGVVLIATAACGKADSGAQVSTGDAHVKALSAAAAKTDEIDTASWKITGTDTADSSNNQSMTGAVDRAHALAEADYSAAGSDGGTADHLVIAGDTVYLKGTDIADAFQVSTPWVSSDMAAWRKYDVFVAEADPFVTFSPKGDPLDGIMTFLQTVSTGVTQVGTANIDGVATTQYHADVALATVQHAVDAKLRETLGTAYDGVSVPTTIPRGTLSVDVWIDDSGYIRRFVGVAPTQSSSSESDGLSGTTVTSQSTGTSTITFDLLGVGSPVHIEVPPVDQVTKVDLSKLPGTFAPTPDYPASTTVTTAG
jgi:hypothetical protein